MSLRHLNRGGSCRRLSYLSMTQIPAFNILALGLKSKTHRLIRGLFSKYLTRRHCQCKLFFSLQWYIPFSLLSSPPFYRGFQDRQSLFTGQEMLWECFIITASVGLLRHRQLEVKIRIFCGGGPSQFQDGPHLVLTVKANVSNQQISIIVVFCMTGN